MKDNRFETKAEIYQALVDGKKITSKYKWDSGGYYHLVRGELKSAEGKKVAMTFHCPGDWFLFEPSKRLAQAFVSKHGEVKYAIAESIDAGLLIRSEDYERAPGFDREEGL